MKNRAAKHTILVDGLRVGEHTRTWKENEAEKHPILIDGEGWKTLSRMNEEYGLESALF